MTSKLARDFYKKLVVGAVPESSSKTKAKLFYTEVCRCLPFVHRIMHLEEVCSVADLRAVVKSKFLSYKDVNDDKIIDMLIFKGREELETFLLMAKQRHHVISEYLEPYCESKVLEHKTGNSAFLDSFMVTNYTDVQQKL